MHLRYTRRGWRMGDTSVVAYKSRRGVWKLDAAGMTAGASDVREWLSAHLRGATFETRGEAVQTVLALAALYPLPESPVERLVFREAGHHSSRDGRFHARRENRHYWTVSDVQMGDPAQPLSQIFAGVHSLREAAEQIATRRRTS